MRSAATPCDQPTSPAAQKNSPKPLRVADLDDAVRVPATSRESRGGGTRTPDTRIMIPLATSENSGKQVGFQNSAAAGAAVETPAAPFDRDLLSVIETWADLPRAVKAGIVAMVRASGTSPPPAPAWGRGGVGLVLDLAVRPRKRTSHGRTRQDGAYRPRISSKEMTG